MLSGLYRNRHSVDDFLIMFQYERDAQRVYETIIKRMELSKEKTRILPFGRNLEKHLIF